MHALSIQQPWAWAIFHMGKDVENRTWYPPRKFIGKRILIHTGKRVDKDGFDDVEDICGTRPPLELTTGALVGTVKLVGVIKSETLLDKSYPWWNGGIGFLLSDQEPLDTPIPCRGQLGFWEPYHENFQTEEAWQRYKEIDAWPNRTAG